LYFRENKITYNEKIILSAHFRANQETHSWNHLELMSSFQEISIFLWSFSHDLHHTDQLNLSVPCPNLETKIGLDS